MTQLRTWVCNQEPIQKSHSSFSKVEETNNSLETHGPLSLACASANNKELLSQGKCKERTDTCTVRHTHARTPDNILVFKSMWEDRWKNWWSGFWWTGALIIVPKISIPESLFLFHHDGFILFFLFYKWKNSISESIYYFRYYILPGWSILMTKK